MCACGWLWAVLRVVVSTYEAVRTHVLLIGRFGSLLSQQTTVGRVAGVPTALLLTLYSQQNAVQVKQHEQQRHREDSGDRERSQGRKKERERDWGQSPQTPEAYPGSLPYPVKLYIFYDFIVREKSSVPIGPIHHQEMRPGWGEKETKLRKKNESLMVRLMTSRNAEVENKLIELRLVRGTLLSRGYEYKDCAKNICLWQSFVNWIPSRCFWRASSWGFGNMFMIHARVSKEIEINKGSVILLLFFSSFGTCWWNWPTSFVYL